MSPKIIAISVALVVILAAASAVGWSTFRRPTWDECTALYDAETEATIDANTPEGLRGGVTEAVIDTVANGVSDMLRERSQADDRRIRQCTVTMRNHEVRARLRELGYD